MISDEGGTKALIKFLKKISENLVTKSVTRSTFFKSSNFFCFLSCLAPLISKIDKTRTKILGLSIGVILGSKWQKESELALESTIRKKFEKNLFSKYILYTVVFHLYTAHFYACFQNSVLGKNALICDPKNFPFYAGFR